jgi:hypothetical protein
MLASVVHLLLDFDQIGAAHEADHDLGTQLPQEILHILLDNLPKETASATAHDIKSLSSHLISIAKKKIKSKATWRGAVSVPSTSNRQSTFPSI